MRQQWLHSSCFTCSVSARPLEIIPVLVVPGRPAGSQEWGRRRRPRSRGHGGWTWGTARASGTSEARGGYKHAGRGGRAGVWGREERTGLCTSNEAGGACRLPASLLLLVTRPPWSPGRGHGAPQGRAGSEGYQSVRSRGPEFGRQPRVASPQHSAQPERARGRLCNRPHCSGGPPPWRTSLLPHQLPPSLSPAGLPAGNAPPLLSSLHQRVGAFPIGPPAICTRVVPWHPPRAILSGVSRYPDSRPARSQLWAGAWAASPPTPSASSAQFSFPSGWASCASTGSPSTSPPLLVPTPPVGPKLKGLPLPRRDRSAGRAAPCMCGLGVRLCPLQRGLGPAETHRAGPRRACPQEQDQGQ